MGAVALVLALTGGASAFGALTSESSANAAVTSAMTDAIGSRTATVSVSGSVSAGGQVLPVLGSGQLDFASGASEMQMTIGNDSIGRIDESVIFDGDVLYFNLGDLISQMVPGKSWVSLDLSSVTGSGVAQQLGPTGGLTTNDPAAVLRALSEEGGVASDLGPSTVGGFPVEGYSVTLDPSAVRAALDRSGLPAWMKRITSQISDTGLSYRVYIDGSGQLRRLESDSTESADGQTVATNETLDFSGYGETLTIAAPPSGKVVPFLTFVKIANSEGSNSAST